MNDKARIALAEAMDVPQWEAFIDPGNNPGMVELPDPFTDANDDYAVLEWALEQSSDFVERFRQALWTTWEQRSHLVDLTWASWNYLKGDYARAACKVLGIKIVPTKPIPPENETFKGGQLPPKVRD